MSQAPLPVTTPPTLLDFKFTLMTVWFNPGDQEETAAERVRLVGPNGEKPTLQAGEQTLVVKPRGFGRMFTNIAGLPYFGNGVYWFETSTKKGGAGTPLGRVPLETSVILTPAKRHSRRAPPIVPGRLQSLSRTVSHVRAIARHPTVPIPDELRCQINKGAVTEVALAPILPGWPRAARCSPVSSNINEFLAEVATDAETALLDTLARRTVADSLTELLRLDGIRTKRLTIAATTRRAKLLANAVKRT
jgi:hypothetical protein